MGQSRDTGNIGHKTNKIIKRHNTTQDKKLLGRCGVCHCVNRLWSVHAWACLYILWEYSTLNVASNCQMKMERLKKTHDICMGVLNEKYIKETTLRNTISLHKFCQAVQHQKMRHLLHPVNE